MKITLDEAVALIRSMEDVLLLTHQSPDGDTLGSASALCRALLALGKRARVVCSDGIPEKYDYLFRGLPAEEFEPKTVVAVDIADPQLLGKALSVYAGRVKLCIDHHPSNTLYAEHTLLNGLSSATAELVYSIVKELRVEITSDMADGIYTGIATDTGCFKFTNTTPWTHTVAAEMMERGADYGEINRLMFDTVTKERLTIERMALDTLELHFDGRCAILYITRAMRESSGAADCDLEGITSLPRKIKGVEIGITVREKEPGKYKISVRTRESIDASRFCGLFGGGGHARAAGCQASGSYEELRARLLREAELALGGSC